MHDSKDYKLIRQAIGTLCRESLAKAPSHSRAEHRLKQMDEHGGGNESEWQNMFLDTIVWRTLFSITMMKIV